MRRPALFRTLASLGTLAALLALAACQSVSYAPAPKHPGDTLLVVTSVYTNETTSANWDLDFQFVFDNFADPSADNVFTVSTGTYFVKDLKPGAHTLSRLVVRSRKSGQMVWQMELADTPFTMTAGAITVLPVRLTATMKKTPQGTTVMYFGTHNLLERDVKEVLGGLEEYENIELWQSPV